MCLTAGDTLSLTGKHWAISHTPAALKAPTVALRRALICSLAYYFITNPHGYISYPGAGCMSGSKGKFTTGKDERAEARAALMNLLQQQERYFTQNNTYEIFAVGAAGINPFKDYSSSEGGPTKSSHRLGARICSAIGTVTPTIRDCVEVFAEPQTGVYDDPIVTSLAIDTQSRKSCNLSYTDLAKCWR